MLSEVSIRQQKGQAAIASTVALVSFAMLFATLFLGYFVFRLTNPVWPPMGMSRASLVWPTISTGIIFLSSLALEKTKTAYLGNKNLKWNFFGSTLILGILFMVSQFRLWNHMAEKGLFVAAGIFPSLLYSFTWIHAGHMVLGFLALLTLIPKLRKTRDLSGELRFISVAKFWHFLGIIWAILFLTMFVF